MSFRKVRLLDNADGDAINVHLFRNARRQICGWYIGPLEMREERIAMSYLSPSEETRASIAVVRAIAVAKAQEMPICVIDPDDLWETAWPSAREDCDDDR